VNFHDSFLEAYCDAESLLPSRYARDEELRMESRETKGWPRFRDQVALVVGAGHGIGKAIAVRLGREGAEVVIADIDAKAMELTVQEMQDEGSKALGVVCDVRNSDQVRAGVQQVLDWHGRIDILMHIAGIAPAKPFLELDEATLDDTLNVNLRGAFLVARAVTPHMVARRRQAGVHGIDQ
jgi:NAD(P)-dependent dehydrogenase (short-subunit alcohol dehydrogenase family)